jgi:8-oxo-dGTP diphosphatase
MKEFSGAKVALLYNGKLIMQLRDDKPGLRFSNMWDFPGGGREGEETAIECATREIEEEFGITLKPDSFIWQKEYPAMHDPKLKAYFLVARASKQEVEAIKFGDEGQRWDFMEVGDFFKKEDVVPHLKGRFQDYLDIVSTEEKLKEDLLSQKYDKVYVWNAEPGEMDEEHSHPFDTKLVIISGKIRIKELEGDVITDYLFKEGDSVEISKGQLHSAEVGAEGCKYVVAEKH